jgi:hypothetical protein
MNQPETIVHADWGTPPGKRWQARAERGPNALYTLYAPEPVGETATWLDRLRPGGGVLLGLDFPIGLPLAYADRAGITDFAAALPELGRGTWAEFYHVATRPEEIGLRRPFYPQRPGQTRQQHLIDGLDVRSADDLRRVCDRGTAERRPAAPLFWTLGAQQVGKAAISGWRDVLGPALRERTDVTLWPFAGPLATLLRAGGIVVAESYPAEFYGHLGLAFPPGPDGRRGKRVQFSRAANAPALLTWAATLGVALHPALREAISDGFGATADGEDRFDALVGLVGMLNVVLGVRPPGEPDDPRVRRVEGWILGQAPETKPGAG